MISQFIVLLSFFKEILSIEYTKIKSFYNFLSGFFILFSEWIK